VPAHRPRNPDRRAACRFDGRAPDYDAASRFFQEDFDAPDHMDRDAFERPLVLSRLTRITGSAGGAAGRQNLLDWRD
jgi:hypothetical protein